MATITERTMDSPAPPKTRPPVSDHYAALAARVIAMRVRALEGKSLGVTSCNPGEGTTTIVNNLAIALAAGGHSVLLVDVSQANLPASLATSSTAAHPRSEPNQEPSDRIRPTSTPGVDRVLLGDAPPASPRMITAAEAWLPSYKERYDFVLLDLPAANPLSGCYGLAPLLDGVILVVQAGRVSTSAAQRVQSELEQVGAHLVGAVLNKSKSYVPKFLARWLGARTTEA